MLNLIIILDHQLTFLFNHLLPHTPFVTSLFFILSLLGNYAIIWIILTILITFFNKQLSKKPNFLLIFIILITLLSLIISILIKPIIKRKRPYLVYNNSITYHQTPHDYSFPSGHAAISFASFYLLSKKDKKRKSLYFILASLISYSRLFLGVHYFSDVIIGATIGYVYARYSYSFIYSENKLNIS